MIRSACEADLEALTHLTQQLGYELSQETLGQNLRAVLSSPGKDLLLYEEGGRAIGMISMSEEVSITEPRFGLVTALVVDERDRGKGIGQELLRAALAWCKSRDLTRMRLRANVVRTDAHRFYERFGFKAKKDQRVFEILIQSEGKEG